MIHIQFNDETILLQKNCSVAELLMQKKFLDNYFAVALNRHFVARTQYDTTFLQEGDIIELIFPMQGG